MEKLRVEVDRRRWIRGGRMGTGPKRRETASVLLCYIGGNEGRCCVGFATEAGGVDDEAVLRKGQLDQVCDDGRVAGEGLHPALAALVEPRNVRGGKKVWRASRLGDDLYFLNDAAGPGKSEEWREREIKAAGDKAGIEFVFVG